ncbi:MAG: DUF721 domain-containing protein [Parabacteroides sp.]
MLRKNTQKLGDVLRDFFEDRPELFEKILEVRAQRGWEALLGPTVAQYTNRVFVKDRVMYVSLTSAVLRSELTLCSDRLLKSLNEYAGTRIIDKLVIR